jgi:hypothetical protein
MLSLLPHAVPPLAVLLADMGNPSASAVALALGVTARTVQRWQSADEAPRVALLALFWLTRWGQSAVNCQAVNDARMLAQRADVLHGQNVALRVELARLLRLGRFDCANDVTTLAGPHLAAVVDQPAVGNTSTR